MDTIDESRGTVADTLDLDVAIARHATAEFDDSTSLADAGLESLSLIRLAVEAAADEDAEIDATRLVDIHNIGDLKVWLRELAAAAAGAQES